MKKIIDYIYIIMILILSVSLYMVNKSSGTDPIVFEMSRHNSSVPPPNIGPYDRYYALKDDNMLVWVYGTGELGYGTYGSYFKTVNEKGYLYLTDAEAAEITKLVKATTKRYSNVRPEYNRIHEINDGWEWIIKYKNKFYNEASEDIPLEDKSSFYSVETKILKTIEKYEELYTDEIDNYTYTSDNYKFISYAALQDAKKQQSE